MRIFSYRNKQRLKRALIVLAVAVLLLAVVCVSYVIYLGRYMVYSSDGAQLVLPDSDAEQPNDSAPPDASVAVPGDLVIGDKIERPDSFAPIVDDDTQQDAATSVSFTDGYYADSASLMNASVVHEALVELLSVREADAPTIAVMLDLKSEFGNFYYSSNLPEAPTASVDIGAVDTLIEWLGSQSDVYMIARVPAFRDTAYALSHTDRSLALSSGALWADSGGCYWLDPGNSLVLDRLIDIRDELAELGFDEVIFENFCFPNGESIVYDADWTSTIADAAATLIDGANIPVSFSFTKSDAKYAAAVGGLHLCLEAEDGSGILTSLDLVADALTGDNQQIIFLSSSRDTRFNAYQQLRPVLDN